MMIVNQGTKLPARVSLRSYMSMYDVVIAEYSNAHCIIFHAMEFGIHKHLYYESRSSSEIYLDYILIYIRMRVPTNVIYGVNKYD